MFDHSEAHPYDGASFSPEEDSDTAALRVSCKDIVHRERCLSQKEKHCRIQCLSGQTHRDGKGNVSSRAREEIGSVLTEDKASVWEDEKVLEVRCVQRAPN